MQLLRGSFVPVLNIYIYIYEAQCLNVKCTLSQSKKQLNYDRINIPLQVDMHLKVTKDLSHMTSMSQKASWSREKAKQYPQHVSVFRGASLYARIAEPQALHDLVISSSAPSYGLETPTDAFKVTRRGGIIYVSKVTALHKMPDTFK